MLNIYFGRENKDKERFLFESVRTQREEPRKGQAEETRRTLILVPDQFTLEAEKQAFARLRVRCLMDLEIISPSRLAQRAVNETGGLARLPLDRYGRHMLLTRILSEEREELGIFRGMERKTSFLEMINDFISELKQFNTDPGKLREAAGRLEPGSLLRRKLDDICRIYDSYENRIAGNVLDAEDALEMAISRLPRLRDIGRTDVWVWGFDSLTPKNMDLLAMLMKHARSLSVLLTCDDTDESGLFSITGMVLKRLTERAEQEGISTEARALGPEWNFPAEGPGRKAPAIEALERELFAVPCRPAENADGLTLTAAAGPYAEAETAAAEIRRLVREEGLRYRDMAVICNDTENSGSILKRVFEEYGIPVFFDAKRSVAHNPLIEYILSLLESISGRFRREDLFRMAKTGLTDLSGEEVEVLENYASEYRIKGGAWKKTFTRGGAERAALCEALRQRLMDPVLRLAEALEEAPSAGEKAAVLSRHLWETDGIEEKMTALSRRQRETGSVEAAEETAQIWDAFLSVTEQLCGILGTTETDLGGFILLLESGLSAVELGILPPAADRVTVGTTQRTRTTGLKALLVTGANEGILPLEEVREGLLSEDEKTALFEGGTEICKIDAFRVMEERLAVYRTLTAPERFLRISFSAADAEGRERKPSPVVAKIREIFPMLQPEKDIVSAGDPVRLASAGPGARDHLSRALRRGLEGDPVDPAFRSLLFWMGRNAPAELGALKASLFSTGRKEPIPPAFAEALYRAGRPAPPGSPLRLSPSRIEKYGRCPFSHFIRYGIRPEEPRVFEVGSREAGDLYHEVLMRFSRELSGEGSAVSGPGCLWQTITEEECRGRIGRIAEEAMEDYREGLFRSGEETLYRSGRLRETCFQTAWRLVDQMRRGKVERIELEAVFGTRSGSVFPPVRVEIPGGTALIEGKIDRADILPGGRVKIIDYKSGRERFDTGEARGGYRLQLMLYLKAAQDAVNPQKTGAGVFYFHIDEPLIAADTADGETLAENVESALRRAFRMDGILLEDPEVISQIDEGFEKFSAVAPLRETKEGIKGTRPGVLLSEEEMKALQDAVAETVKKLCAEMAGGVIEAAPRRTSGKETACDYCGFRGICRFDLSMEGCRYVSVADPGGKPSRD